MSKQGLKLLRSKMFWVGILYFSEGFPLGIFYDVFPVQFRQMGVDLAQIGLMSLLGLSWTLKFLWAPAVDYYRRHRLWILCVEVLMGLLLCVFAAKSNVDASLWLTIGVFTLASATNDIAIDGYTIELLNKDELGIANGIRIALYRVGMLTAGLILILSDFLSWRLAYLAAAALLCLCGGVCLLAPREREVERGATRGLAAEFALLARHPLALSAVCLFFLIALRLADQKAGWSRGNAYFWPVLIGAAVLLLIMPAVRPLSGARKDTGDAVKRQLQEGPMFGALFEILQRPYIVPVIIFILVFKLADSSMGFMIKPFWVDSGFSNSEIGLVSVNIGLGLSIAGGILGGWFTDRLGIFKALWILGLAQAFSNLGYAAAAFVIPSASGGAGAWNYKALMYGASMIESFTGGLGTAAFLAFLMAIVNKQKAAAEYAIFSSIFAFSRSIAGWAGGLGAQSWGYAFYFTLTFFLAFPAYFFLPWVKKALRDANGADSPSA